MKLFKWFLMISCLSWILSLSACRTMDGEFTSISPELLRQALHEQENLLKQGAEPPQSGPSQSSVPWFLVSAAVLAGLILIFTSDRRSQAVEKPTASKTKKRTKKPAAKSSKRT